MDIKDIIIEPLKEDESTAIAHFVDSLLHSEHPDLMHHLAADDLDNVFKSYNGKRDTFFVVKHNGDIIATAAIKEESKEVALLRRFFVAPEQRNKGIGPALINKIIQFCTDHNYQMISFRGNNQMDNAIQIIEQMGFIRKDIIDFGEFHMYIYVKLL